MSDYEPLLPGKQAGSPRASEPDETRFLRSSGQVDPYEDDSFYTARGSFSTPQDGGQFHGGRADASAGQDGFDIEAFRRQFGMAPAQRPPQAQAPVPPRPALLGGRHASVDSDDSIFSSDESSSERSMSTDSVQTRTNSRDFRFNNPIAELNRGRDPVKKRGFFRKMWSWMRGRGWR